MRRKSIRNLLVYLTIRKHLWHPLFTEAVWNFTQNLLYFSKTANLIIMNRKQKSGQRKQIFTSIREMLMVRESCITLARDEFISAYWPRINLWMQNYSCSLLQEKEAGLWKKLHLIKYSWTGGIRILLQKVSSKKWCSNFTYLLLTDASMRYSYSIIVLQNRSLIASITDRHITRELKKRALKNHWILSQVLIQNT